MTETEGFQLHAKLADATDSRRCDGFQDRAAVCADNIINDVRLVGPLGRGLAAKVRGGGVIREILLVAGGGRRAVEAANRD